MDDLLQEFIAETRETLDALASEIVAWEADPADRARLDAMFRFVHTVKGSCGFLDLPRLARLSHAAEDVLAAVRSGERSPDTALVNAVLAIVDRIGELVEAIDAGTALADDGEDALIAALEEDAEPALAAAPAAPAAVRGPARSVRLNVDLLDRMMGGMSDMVLARNELARRLRDGGADPRVEAALERLSATVAEMRDTVTRTRMQKIDTLFSALPRMVRDIAAGLGKSVALTLEGTDVELDREMVEVMRDPLAHIVRNALDHGIEPPGERRAAGKRETGRLIVAARQSGNQIIIEVTDDGRGVDVERVVAKLARQGGRSEAELRALSDKAKLELIFAPGLSTNDEANAISGRGVGMDVVRVNVEQIGGRIDLANAPGRGLTIAMHVPLTLSIISTVIVGAGGLRFAVPRQVVEEIVADRHGAFRIDRLGEGSVATVRGRRMPLLPLASALGVGDTQAAPGLLVVVGTRAGHYALGVDEVLDTEELVVKPAAPAIAAAGVYAGQMLPDSGEPMLLLDVAGLAEREQLRFEAATLAAEAAGDPVADGPRALLFIDLDGRRRAMALGLIDRLEPAAAAAVRHSAGRLRLTVGDRLIPLLAVAPIEARDPVPVLRLSDGADEIGYAIAEPIDIVTLPLAVVPASQPGPIAGAVVLDGEQVEVIDGHWLFAQEAAGTGTTGTAAGAPLCWLQPDAEGWMHTFLRPILEQLGYRVAAAMPADDQPQLAVVLDEGAAPPARVPVVRLSRHRGVGAIWRYDRDAVIAAIGAAERTRA